MWRRVEKSAEDTQDLILLMELGDPDNAYKVSATKGDLEHQIEFAMSKANDENYQHWLYDTPEGKIAFVFSIEDFKFRIRTCVPVNFDADLYQNCYNAFPIIIEKLKLEMTLAGVTQGYSISPRTKTGEVMAMLVDKFIKEATVMLHENKNSWLITFDFNEKKLNEELVMVPVRKTKVDADAAPESVKLENVTVTKNV